MFINETTNKFIDYEYALTEIENNLELDTNVKVDEETSVTVVNDNNDGTNNENVATSEPLENDQYSNIHENNE
jgi:hypothetical protein